MHYLSFMCKQNTAHLKNPQGYRSKRCAGPHFPSPREAMPHKAAFHQALVDLTAQIAGRPLDSELQDWLNQTHGPDSAAYAGLKAACLVGVEEEWLSDREGGGIRYGRVFKADEALHRFSVDVVDMQDIAGPHHSHPLGEIDLILPLTAGATFDGHPAGRCVHPPASAPVLGEALVRGDCTGLDLPEAFAFARDRGGAALRAMTYRERAALLAAVVKGLQAHRERYYDIATANSGTVKKDSAADIYGGIFTLGQYARWGDALGDVRVLRDGDAVKLGKEPVFLSQHLQVPTRGVALFINAFNFPAWGLWEKAAPALLSAAPVMVKPATATAWLTQRMVKDVIDAGVLPAGALSVIAGSSAGLMDQLQPFDVVSFTGSAETAGVIRSHPAVAHRSVRANIEADSLNSALLLPDATVGSDAFNLLVREVVREMTVKSEKETTSK